MSPDQPSSGCRVLVIEDEVLVAMGMEMTLVEAGYLVVGPVGRFDQAMQAAQAEEADVALLDVNLRGAEVYPVADQLSARGIPFVFLTGYDRTTLPARFAERQVVRKPFQRDELLSTLKALTTANSAC